MKNFLYTLKTTKIQATLVVYQLKDMQDWDAAKNGKLRPISQKFDLNNAMNELIEMMKIRAEIK